MSDGAVRHRQLSCHCGGKRVLCECFQPVEWNFKTVMCPAPSIERVQPATLPEPKLGQWVAVVYGARWHLGQVKQVENGGADVKVLYMAEGGENKYAH